MIRSRGQLVPSVVVSLALAVAALLLALAACSSPTPTPDPLPAPGEQRIVYVSGDFAVFTIREDGAGRLRIIGSGGATGGVQSRPLLAPAGQQTASPDYTWPTWAPGGARLAVSRVPGPTEGSLASLVVLRPPSAVERHVHETPDGLLDRVADGAPHYAQWSPDGERLTFVAPNEEGLALKLYEASFDGGEPEAFMENAPVYHIWAPDSQSLLVHRGPVLFLRDAAGGMENLGRSSLRYRVPAYSPDSSSIAYVADLGIGEQLVIRDLASGDERELLPVFTQAAFAWSPVDGDVMAVVRRALGRAPDYAGLTLLDTRTGEQREIYEGGVMAFYWSPDGSKLALVTTQPNDRGLQWTMVDAASGDARTLATFAPSREFLTHVQFFDQFGPSHLLWSADSRSLVFAGAVLEGDEQVIRGPDHAWVLSTEGETQPVRLAEARLAFFVPPAVE